jgi:adenylylsulfate reductase subunit A
VLLDIAADSGSVAAPSENDSQPISAYEEYLSRTAGLLTVEQLEEAMQKVMDEYAGGISTDYQYNESRLAQAADKISHLTTLLGQLAADDMDDLLRIYEVRERLVVCQVLIEHLRARKETRWHSFAEHTDYPEIDEQYRCYINSRRVDGQIELVYRSLVEGSTEAVLSDKGEILKTSSTGREVSA